MSSKKISIKLKFLENDRYALEINKYDSHNIFKK